MAGGRKKTTGDRCKVAVRMGLQGPLGRGVEWAWPRKGGGRGV